MLIITSVLILSTTVRESCINIIFLPCKVFSYFFNELLRRHLYFIVIIMIPCLDTTTFNSTKCDNMFKFFFFCKYIVTVYGNGVMT